MIARPAFLRAFLFVCAYVFAAYAQAALPSGVRQGASVEGITQYELANGLKVLLFPDASKPVVTVNVTYLVGSRQENYGETGMAHLLEHMLFKGTPSIPSVFSELSRRGMRFNGTTYYDRTNFFETFPASEENLDWALRMESERMTRSTFSKAQLDTEMTVVRNEYENGENQPTWVLAKRMEAVAYDWHNYAHAPIGARSDIENVPFEKLRAYYRMYYQPDNAVLVVAGSFDPASALAKIARYFGAIAKPTRALPVFYTQEPVQDGEREVTIRRVGSEQDIAALFRTMPGPHPDQVAIDAFGEIMAAEPSGRLYKSLIESHKAAGVASQAYALHDPGFIIFFVQVNTGDSLAAARTTMLDTLYGIKSAPVTEAEVARVRARALKDFDQTLSDPSHLGVALSDAIGQGDWRLFFLERDRWRALKAEDVQRVALEYVKPANATIGEFVPDAQPDRAPIPPSVDVAAMVKDYRGDAAVGAGETFDPTPAALEARTRRSVLPNGMKLALLPKKTRGATVQFTLELRYGDENSLQATDSLGTLAGAMLSRGTLAHDRQSYSDALDAARANVDFEGGPTSVAVRGQTVRENLPQTLRLIAEALRSPAFPASELETLKRERIGAFEQARTDPQEIASRALERHDNPYPPSDVRYEPTLDEEIARIQRATLDDIKAYHKRFYGMGEGELAIVGDFDAAEVATLARELFGDWSSATPYVRVPQPYRATTSATLTFETPDKANAVLMGAIAMPLTDAAADYAALIVAERALGGGADSRLFDRIRVRGGLSYSVGTEIEPAHIDPNSKLDVYAIFAPQNLGKVQSALDDELSRVLASGFGDAEIASARRAILEERTIARTRDSTLAAALVTQAWLGRTWTFSGDLDQAIAKVDAKEATTALRKYVDAKRIAYAVAGDLAKVGAAARP
jgi:zinc protease